MTRRGASGGRGAGAVPADTTEQATTAGTAGHTTGRTAAERAGGIGEETRTHTGAATGTTTGTATGSTTGTTAEPATRATTGPATGTTPETRTEEVAGPTTGPTTGTTTGTESAVAASAGTVPSTVESTPGTPATRPGADLYRRDYRGDSTQSLREEIEHTRHELGETVAALAAKTDVKSRAKGTARGMVTSAASQAQHLLHPMEEKAKRTGRVAKVKSRRIKDKAVEAAESEETRTKARRGGMITTVVVGLALLELLRRRRNARLTDWERAVRAARRRGTMAPWRAHMGARIGGAASRARLGGRRGPFISGGAHHIAPGLYVRNPGRGFGGMGRSALGRMGTGRRSFMSGGAHHIAPGLYVRNPGSGFGGSFLSRMGMGRRPHMLSGSHRIAPGLHVRSRRMGFGGGGLFGLGRYALSRMGMGRSGIGGGIRVRRSGLFGPRPGIRVRSRRRWGYLS
ncbi:DUF3618 domain-containing protein [Thermopolyspora sp. NPDC052614]|uniref:DUF3618 domain-containing protein n=1 Tax=Thermopolyspora sp. NPDC052614 TaxID=3155682 RepID=UPI00343D097E